ncbi:unnamed protein product [Durusdinium trenchii]|uniref:EF-hand domain-containing protein n=1 Tax=Durusdinium trenchii TaxID=1381693 RepID=A0ABP0PAQ6_9DINO
MDSLQSLFWTMVLIFACLYAVAVVLTQLVSDHKIAIGREGMEAEHEEPLLEFFGSLDTTMISLYMVISEGIHWRELMDPLVENMGGWVRIVFVTFTGFELFAMMNIITACFVDSAMMIAANAEKQECLESLWGLLDADANYDARTQKKIVTKEQFIGSYGEPSMTKFLDLINAHTEDPKQVFAMIDRDGDGALTAPEFLICCERLMGPSKASMLVKIANEQRIKMEQQERQLQKVGNEIKVKQDEMLTIIKTLDQHDERSSPINLLGAKIDFAAFKLQTCCGTGLAPRNSIQLAKTGGFVVCAEVLLPRLKQARHNAHIYRCETHLDFLQADVKNGFSLANRPSGSEVTQCPGPGVKMVTEGLDGRQLVRSAMHLAPQVALYLPRVTAVEEPPPRYRHPPPPFMADVDTDVDRTWYTEKVTRFHPERGWGFIELNGMDIMVHVNDCKPEDVVIGGTDERCCNTKGKGQATPIEGAGQHTGIVSLQR